MKLFKRNETEASDPTVAPPELVLSVATVALPEGLELPSYGDAVDLVVTFKVVEESVRDTWDGKKSRRRVVLDPKEVRIVQ